MNALDEINHIVQSWLLRYRLQRALRWSGRGFLVGLILGTILALWIVPRTDLLLAEYTRITIGLAITWPGLAGLAGYLWPVNRAHAIRYFDRRFNLRERISTAVEFSHLKPSVENLLSEQQQDALEHARKVDLGSSQPWRLPWLELGAALAIILLLASLTARNQPYFLAALKKQDLTKLIQEQANALEEIQANIQAADNLSAEQRSVLDKPLEEAARRLETSQSLEEALGALNQAEQALRTVLPDELLNQSAGLVEAGESIASEDSSPLEAFGQQLAAGDFSEAAQALGTIDPTAMNAEQRADLAASLPAAASALANSNPELAQDLQNAAEEIQSGNPAGAGQALSQASQQLAGHASSLASANAANQAADQLSASQQNLALAGSAASAQATSGSQTGSGQNNGGQIADSGPGSSQGSSGAGEVNGNTSGGASVAGAGQGESQGEGSGAQAGSQPIGTGNQTGDGGEREYESIYAPQRLNSGVGQDIQLPGSGQPGQIIGEAGLAPGNSPEQSLIPYSEVFPVYENIIRQAIESGQVPQHLRALVRDYFSSLAP